MYVAPRPLLADDPLFAIRLAFAAALGFVLAPLLQSSIPALMAALPVGLMAGNRKAFDPRKVFGAPIAFLVMVWFMSSLVSLTRPMPMVLIVLMGVLLFLGFLVIQRTGNPLGMLIVIVTVLMSVMGMSSIAAMEMLRDAMSEACIASLFIIPAMYLLFPVRTREKAVEHYVPAPGHHVKAAAIRAGVQLLLCFWLYSFIEPGNIILAVVATFVLVFPSQQRSLEEARQRMVATLLGAAMALLLLFCFTIVGHLSVMVLLLFLAGLYFGTRMMTGREPPMVYQFGFSAMLALVGGSLTSSEPGYAVLTRVVLTLAGAMAAVLLTALLEALFVPEVARRTSHGQTGQTLGQP